MRPQTERWDVYSNGCLLCGDVPISIRLRQNDTNVYQCTTCGLTFLHPLPRERDLFALYLQYDNMDESHNQFLSHLAWRKKSRRAVFREVLAEILRYKSGGALLEIGCSFGFFLRMAEGSGFQTRGVDLSLRAVQYAKETLKLSVKHGTVFDARFPDDSFDVVTMLGVLEHLPNPVETLREVVRILRKDGILVVEVPNAKFNLVRGKISPSLFYIGNHLYNFTPNALTKMLEACGFRCARVWCGKGDHRSGWLFNTVKFCYVLAARLLQRVFGWYWGPSLIALAVKAYKLAVPDQRPRATQGSC